MCGHLITYLISPFYCNFFDRVRDKKCFSLFIFFVVLLLFVFVQYSLDQHAEKQVEKRKTAGYLFETLASPAAWF